MKVAIFASGTGSNFEALADNLGLQAAGLEIMCLVCDQPQAPVIEKAIMREIPVKIVPAKKFATRADHERAIAELIAPLDVRYILLAGYMRVITPVLLNEYPGHIINIHPSILPAFSGLKSIERAYDADVEATGVTIHYIDEGVDSGPMIAQAKVPINRADSVEVLEQQVHDAEHQLYPAVVYALLKNSK